MSAGSTDGFRAAGSWAECALATSLRTVQAELGGLFGPAYARLRSPIWVFDFDHKRVLWGNPAALELWRAPDLEELLCRCERVVCSSR